VRENEREPFDALSHRTPALRSEIRSTVFASVTKVCVSCAQSDGRILSAAPARAASGLSTSSRTADSRFLGRVSESTALSCALRRIARSFARAPSTVSREIPRNSVEATANQKQCFRCKFTVG
jgi:hypothetical protein